MSDSTTSAPSSALSTSLPSSTSTSSSATSTSTSATSTSTTTASSTVTSTSTTSTTSTSTTESSSAAASSSTTTASSTTSLPTSTPEPSPSSVFSTVVTGSNGPTVITSIIPVTATPSARSTAAASVRDTGFFNHKGAVAGTFSAVGVVVAAILVFLATRWIRRRREKKFDAEIDEVAAAAAAAGANPDFTHDDYDYRSGNTNFGAYSETSHGTLAQPPLSHPDTYAPDVGYGGDPYSNAGVGGGAAGIGAGIGTAAAMQRARSQRSGGNHEPYHAFAAPHEMPPAVPENYEMSDANQLRYRRSTGPYQYDPIIGGYGAGDDPYAIARGPSQRKPTLSRNASSGTQAMAAEAGHVGYNQPGQPFVSPYAQQPPLPPMPPPKQQFGGDAYRSDDAYGGLDAQPSADLPNPHSASASQANLVQRHSEESEGGERPSYLVDHDQEHDEHSEDEDEDEQEHNPRVLRVANE